MDQATLDLDKPSNGHSGGSTTYSVYALGAFGSYSYSGIGTGTTFGSITCSAANNGSTVQLTLNNAGLAAIAANQGLSFSLGGVSTGEGSNAHFNHVLQRQLPSLGRVNAQRRLLTHSTATCG